MGSLPRRNQIEIIQTFQKVWQQGISIISFSEEEIRGSKADNQVAATAFSQNLILEKNAFILNLA